MPVTHESNIQSIRKLSMARRGHIELQLGLDACFSSKRIELRLSWTERGGEVELDAAGDLAKHVRLSVEEVQSFAENVADALLRTEVPLGGRSTTRYFGSARWEAILDQDHEAGEARWETNDLRPDAVAELLAKRPELSSRIPTSVYVVAFGIRAVVDQLEQVIRSRPGVEHGPGC
jgi:hypothetical protein